MFCVFNTNKNALIKIQENITKHTSYHMPTLSMFQHQGAIIREFINNKGLELFAGIAPEILV
jgi:hypothetical protein